MDNPRPEKVAVVTEVRDRLSSVDAAILTEYRGLTVAEMASLRRSLAAVGGDYKVYKNTLVKLAVAGGEHEPLQPLLVGPTAIAFVSGDVSAVAKALRDFSRANPALVLKGAMFEGGLLSAEDLAALAELPSRDVLLSRLAGGFAAPMQQMAGLLQALPRNLAYGLKALVDKGGAAGETAAAEAPGDAAPGDGAGETAAAEAQAPGDAVGETAAAEAQAPGDAVGETAAAEAPGDAAAETAAAEAQSASDGAPGDSAG